MEISIVIQARMGSSRLSGKVLMEMGETTTLDYVIQRCKEIRGATNIIVATSTLKIDDAIETWCQTNNVDYLRGSETDVLSRYVEVVKAYKPDYVMRVTADCPFLDYEMASEMIELIHENPVDVVDVKGELPRGIEVELISSKALMIIDEKGMESRHREHVTYYAYEFPNEFTRIDYYSKSTLQKPNLRITLDTVEDYKLLSTIAEKYNNPLVNTEEVILFLENNQEIAKINSEVEQKIVD